MLSRDKQIEEMAKHCPYYENGICREPFAYRAPCHALKCQEGVTFARIVDAGYRKVDEDYAKQCTCYTLGCQMAGTLEKKVAREIFEEIEHTLNILIWAQDLEIKTNRAIGFNSDAESCGKKKAIEDAKDCLQIVKKKYESEGEDDDL